MNDQITTYTGQHFSVINPDPDRIHIEDIAHALSFMTRAGGHFPEFFSVAQHSIQCCEEALAAGLSQRIALGCLLHDGSEAYIADVTRPLKHQMPQYLEFESRIQEAIYHKYLDGGLTSAEAAAVKVIDDALFYHEFYHYMKERTKPEIPPLSSSPVFETRSFGAVEKQFLRLFRKLTGTDEPRTRKPE